MDVTQLFMLQALAVIGVASAVICLILAIDMLGAAGKLDEQ
jgi:hypothetical protein